MISLHESVRCVSSTDPFRFRQTLRLALLLLLSADHSAAQQDYGSRLGQRGPRGVEFASFGPSVVSENLNPDLRKWYLPQELLPEYKWQTLETTNYARQRYLSYRSPLTEGEYFYDSFGNYLTRGWLVYDWSEERPRSSEGSRILTTGFLSGLNIFVDRKGHHSISIMIGDNIVTTLTPMTFRKATFHGTQLDIQTNRYAATALISRISNPVGGQFEPTSFNNITNLLAGRAEFNLGDRATLGATFVNAHNTRTDLDSFQGNPFKGALTASQLQTQITEIIIRISDDSPSDPGGAILVFDDVEITTRIGHVDTVLIGSQIGFTPEKEGGFTRDGVRVAEGSQEILLRYALTDNPQTPGEIEGLQSIIDNSEVVNNISNVRFRLFLVDDYRVEVTSNNQTNAEGQPVFLTVARAPGNIPDGSNQKQVVFDYGLPTASQILGLTLEARDVLGFNFYGEFDVSQQYRQFPFNRRETHKAFSGIVGDEAAQAWMINLVRDLYPWYFSVEAFYMDEDYSTSSYIVDGTGRVDYEDATNSLYDFVDDNDDNDRLPDQQRRFQDNRTATQIGNEGSTAGTGSADNAIFPGWDENNDFISDFNQNSNRLQDNPFPDYEEPFLRHGVDPPEFLFGIDLNNNGWIDRFENDNEPDYPYKRDHKGYNAYARGHPIPSVTLTVGQTRQSLITDDRKNVTTYGIFGIDRDYPGIGRIQIFDMLKKAEDRIQDDLLQWTVLSGETSGSMEPFTDPLAAQNTWINTAYLSFERRANLGLNFANKFKYETVRQAAQASDHKKRTRLMGLVNKVDYVGSIGDLTVQPRLKSAFLSNNTPYAMGKSERQEWTGTNSVILKYPFLPRSHIELGFERTYFQDTLVDEDGLAEGKLTGDFRNTVLALQLANVSDYLGYHLNTHLGYMMNWRSDEKHSAGDRSETGGLAFLTVYAGLM